MPTTKQRAALDRSVENGGNITQAMRDVGYKESTVNNPCNLTESIGFKQVLKEYGLTESFITAALVEDIKAKPKNRLGELRLGSEILGMKEEQVTNVNIFNYSDEQKLRILTRGQRALPVRDSDGEGESD